MKQLYMISLGGKVKGANIEVHDVQFVVASSIEEAIPLVKEHWYGDQLKLHMDSYVVVQGAEGYDLSLVQETQSMDQRLYFVYLGGYDPSSSQEIHDVRLVVSSSLQGAKSQAIKTLGFDYTQKHVDSVVDVAAKLLTPPNQSYDIKLSPSQETFTLEPDWFGYRRLDQ